MVSCSLVQTPSLAIHYFAKEIAGFFVQLYFRKKLAENFNFWRVERHLRKKETVTTFFSLVGSSWPRHA